jgi:hypothetical protein
MFWIVIIYILFWVQIFYAFTKSQASGLLPSFQVTYSFPSAFFCLQNKGDIWMVKMQQCCIKGESK